MIARNQVVGLIAGVVLIVAALTGALLVGSDAPHSSPEAVVRSYLVAIYEKGDASQYLALVDPQALDQMEIEYGLGRDEIRDWLQMLLDDMQREVEMGASIDFEMGVTERHNGTAETLVTITSSHPEYGDDEFTNTIRTVERDGSWYLEELRW
ncbi:MAG: hypothetical protein IBX67_01810 [Dehalococcoidia bacterium]|nr:hypothetical protein [Dehalococcoidia bacterium]